MSPGPEVRYNIDSIAKLANDKLTREMPRKGFHGKLLAGRFEDNLSWIATQDFDGQIEMSFSYPSKRPNNWEVMRAFQMFGYKPFAEESKRTGKVRHFVVQKGYVQ